MNKRQLKEWILNRVLYILGYRHVIMIFGQDLGDGTTTFRITVWGIMAEKVDEILFGIARKKDIPEEIRTETNSNFDSEVILNSPS